MYMLYIYEILSGFELYDLHTANKRTQDIVACHLVSPTTVCNVQTHCGFSNGHEEINISNYG